MRIIRTYVYNFELNARISCGPSQLDGLIEFEICPPVLIIQKICWIDSLLSLVFTPKSFTRNRGFYYFSRSLFCFLITKGYQNFFSSICYFSRTKKSYSEPWMSWKTFNEPRQYIKNIIHLNKMGALIKTIYTTIIAIHFIYRGWMKCENSLWNLYYNYYLSWIVKHTRAFDDFTHEF